jgi:guanine deaminase
MPEPLLIAGWLLVPDGERTVRPVRGSVELRDGRVAGRNAGDLPARFDLGGEHTLISPAFADTHLHLAQFDSIGQGGMELLDWLDRVVFPAEARWADADYAGQMAARVARQLLSFGTTAIGAYATVHNRAAQAAIEAAGAAGLRGCVGQVLMDRAAPPELLGEAGTLLREAAQLRPSGRIAPAVTPRFAVSCSDDLLRGAGALASRTGWPVQTHLSETERECAIVREQFGGVSYTEVYRRSGLLTARTLLGHGIWLDDAERRTIAAAGSVIAHCPSANLFLKAGAMDLSAHRRVGIRVSLGSDVAGGPDRSMVRVARTMIETAQRLGSAPPPVPDCWWQITRGNAEALGLEGGILETGAPADLLVIGPDIPWTPDAAGLSTLLYAWDDRWLRATIAAGVPAWTP